jgi:hypothetical protein
MIKNLTSSSAHLTVSGSYPPNIYNNGMLNVGDVRYNPNNQNMEVYDGNMWQAMSQGVTIGLSWDADSAIRWAIEKEREEKSLKERMAKHPGLKDAYEKFQMMDILTKEEQE